MKGDVLSIRAGKGWLLGFNAGEFGGGLWWASEDGTKTEFLIGDNVHAFVKRNNEILIFVGLAHMSMDDGAVFSYRTDENGKKTLRLIVRLSSAPIAAIATEDHSVLIAAQAKVFRLSEAGSLQTLYGNEQMGMLYPNSLVINSDEIFVGMRFYVLHLTLAGIGSYRSEWLIPSRCQQAKKKDYSCVCRGDDAKGKTLKR